MPVSRQLSTESPQSRRRSHVSAVTPPGLQTEVTHRADVRVEVGEFARPIPRRENARAEEYATQQPGPSRQASKAQSPTQAATHCGSFPNSCCGDPAAACATCEDDVSLVHGASRSDRRDPRCSPQEADDRSGRRGATIPGHPEDQGASIGDAAPSPRRNLEAACPPNSRSRLWRDLRGEQTSGASRASATTDLLQSPRARVALLSN